MDSQADSVIVELLKGKQHIMQLNALALEYQRDYGAARRDLDISNIVNNPEANGICRVFNLAQAAVFDQMAWIMSGEDR